MASWFTDGSKELSFKGNRLECKSKKSGEPFNALWKDGKNDVKRYWKIRVEKLDEPLFVGITDSLKLKKSWNFQGLMYGRNLSDGSQMLAADFGPEIKSGDVIGIFVDLSDGNKCKVYVDVNGSSLGLAFDLPKAILNEFYPAAHFNGSGAISIEEVKDFPNTTRATPNYQGMEGPWEYTSGSIELQGVSATMTITKENENSYKAILHVVNTTHFKISRDSASSPWKGKLGMSSRMAGPGMKAESEISRFMENLTKITVSGEVLTIVDEKAGKNTTWKRRVIVKSPITSISFR